MHLRVLPGHQNQVLEKDIFQRLEWLKTRCIPSHQNQVLKKDIFLRLEWLKTCFDAFPEITRFCALRFDAFPSHQSLKNSCLMSGVVKNVF
jgi:hypothetical protein